MIRSENGWHVRPGSGEIIGEQRKRGLGGHAKQATRVAWIDQQLEEIEVFITAVEARKLELA